MSLDYQAIPPIDRPDVHERLAAGDFGRWMNHAWWLATQGYCTLELEDGAFLADCEAVIAADAAAADALRAGWIEPDDDPLEVWPLGPTCAEQIASACRTALAHRRG
jgi:hypothetical protein